ncbi:hypothetical protein FPZ54_15850 [Sphingomonas suaedae]|uniref:Uncharacterized protein n=1 Tax=Sphingomonas suaedae TaxID=2599297 RepID=A0A518RIS1_9SPHN|nr:hypothetical protein [Sphingomonas suaedae]QDX27331.1 hypothetical protein FPZ54_15850 [Sphingomonas suaedae]
MGTRRAYTDAAHAPFDQKRKWVRWTKTMRETFLDHLAATCNVRESAAVIGVIPGSVYTLRRREPAFAAAWEEALALGYQMLETRVVGHVLAGRTRHDPLGCGVDSALGPIDFESALRLLMAHRNVPGKPRTHGRGPQFAAPDETDALLLKRLKAIETRRARDAEWAAQVDAKTAGLLTHGAGAGGPVPVRDAATEHAPQAEVAHDGE